MAPKWGKAVTQVIGRPRKAGDRPHRWAKVHAAQPGSRSMKPKHDVEMFAGLFTSPYGASQERA